MMTIDGMKRVVIDTDLGKISVNEDLEHSYIHIYFEPATYQVEVDGNHIRIGQKKGG